MLIMFIHSLWLDSVGVFWFFFSVTVFQIGCVIEIHFDNIAVFFLIKGMITQLCVRQIIKYYISLYEIFGFTSRKCFNYLAACRCLVLFFFFKRSIPKCF